MTYLAHHKYIKIFAKSYLHFKSPTSVHHRAASLAPMPMLVSCSNILLFQDYVFYTLLSVFFNMESHVSQLILLTT